MEVTTKIILGVLILALIAIIVWLVVDNVGEDRKTEKYSILRKTGADNKSNVDEYVKSYLAGEGYLPENFRN